MSHQHLTNIDNMSRFPDLLQYHPVVTNNYEISTPITYDFSQRILTWMDDNVPGGIAYGPPRVGKTKAILVAMRNISKKYNNIPIFFHACKKLKPIAIDAFHYQLLNSVGHRFASKGTSAIKQHRLLLHLIEKAETNSHKRLVFFFDEAQQLLEEQFRWLKDLHDDLTRHFISPTFIFVGQESLSHMNTELPEEIIARFMLDDYRFHGLQGAKQVEVCLNSYDNLAIFPENSGCTFTSFFFPFAFDHQWRLASLSNLIWEAFVEVKHVAKLPGKAEFPMTFFIRTVNHVLKKYGNDETAIPVLSKKIWKDAIMHSGYPRIGILTKDRQKTAKN